MIMTSINLPVGPGREGPEHSSMEVYRSHCIKSNKLELNDQVWRCIPE